MSHLRAASNRLNHLPSCTSWSATPYCLHIPRICFCFAICRLLASAYRVWKASPSPCRGPKFAITSSSDSMALERQCLSALEHQSVGGGGRSILLSSCSTFFFLLGGFELEGLGLSWSNIRVELGSLAVLFARKVGMAFSQGVAFSMITTNKVQAVAKHACPKI